jgi:hypothetical protein
MIEFDQSSGSTAVRKDPSHVHDIITGGLEGAVGSIAIDPVVHRIEEGAWRSPFRAGLGKRAALYGATGAVTTGIIGALVSMGTKKARSRRNSDQEMAAIQEIVEFAKSLDDHLPRAKRSAVAKVATGAGIGAAALGLTTLPGASKFFGIRGRIAGKGFIGSEIKNSGGKMVADYIEGAQKLLNTGIKGKVAGAFIQENLQNPGSVVSRVTRKAFGGSGEMGARMTGEHFGRFRAGPKEALSFWDYEHGQNVANRIAKQDAAAKAAGREISPRLQAMRLRAQDEMHYGREEAHRQINEQIQIHGKSEMEAIKHVGYNSDHPQVQHYFTELAKHKARAAQGYAIKSLASPALLAAGTGGIVYGRKKNQSPHSAIVDKTPLRNFDRLAELIELDVYNPHSERQLKSGVRLDKYEKGIRAHEIDRHIHDYLRSTAIGAVAGAVIPAPLRLRNRALIGAGVGAATAGFLHSTGHVDAYGEQSEDAKILQRNAPKYVGGAAIVGGLIARYRNRKAAMLSIVK